MKVLYYDVFCGISGDMNLGALVDLGVELDYLVTELKKLNIEEEYEIRTRRDMKHGISGTKLDVVLFNQHDHSHDHEHAHEHDHGHSHDHGHTHEHTHDRNFKIIEEMILTSDLNERVKSLSVEMFRLVAIAEGKVHNKPIDQVHFHEVGATDSIVDIVGAAICLDVLNVDRIMASSIQVGGGFVKCAHGKMPVPAPATAEILTDVPMKYNIVPFETTTPTGAAILKHNVDVYTDELNFKVEKIGYGLGTKNFEIPNILRVYLGEVEDIDLDVEKQYLTETNIDDMNSELFAYIETKLYDVGALDVFKTSIMMKKGRPAVKLSVLHRKEDRFAIQDIIFRETTSAGLREVEVNKYMLKREFINVDTGFGPVSVKVLYLNGEKLKSKAEYDDCERLANMHKVSIQAIYDAVRKAEQ